MALEFSGSVSTPVVFLSEESAAIIDSETLTTRREHVAMGYILVLMMSHSYRISLPPDKAPAKAANIKD